MAVVLSRMLNLRSRSLQSVASSEKKFNSGESLRGARREDDDDLATACQAGDSEYRRCQGRSGSPRGGEQGREAEESPSNKGAVRARGEASLEVQGVQCLSARSSALSGARSAVGQEYASTVVSALSARSAVGQESASTVVGALSARSAVGLQYASTVVGALYARSAVVLQYASTVVGALSARSAVGLESASTVVGALSARSAVGHRYASTVVGALSARSAVGLKSASTVVGALSARSAVGHKYASTVVIRSSARSARSSERIINQTNIF